MNGIMKKMLHDVELNNLAEKEEIGEERYTYTRSFDFKLTAIAKILDINKNILKELKFIASDLL